MAPFFCCLFSLEAEEAPTEPTQVKVCERNKQNINLILHPREEGLRESALRVLA